MHTHPEKGRLTAIRQTLAGLGIEAAAIRLAVALKYNPDWRSQPRKPRGNPDGGQWTNGGGVQVAVVQTLLPVIARGAPLAARLYETGKRVAPFLRRMPHRWDPNDGFLKDGHFDSETGRIGSPSSRRSDHEIMRFKDEKELKKHLGPAGRNHHWHHIVEKRLARDGVFPPEVIHSTDNIISLPDEVHYCINGEMGSYYQDTGLRTRIVVSTWTFAEQFNYGLDLIYKCYARKGYVPNGDPYTGFERR